MSNDFLNDFSGGSSSLPEVPSELSASIKNTIRFDLVVHYPSLILKLIMLHGLVGFLTLYLCPQFNLSLTNNYEVFHYLHHSFGAFVCDLVCGAIFMSSGALIAWTVLRPVEVKKLSNLGFLFYLPLSLFAVAIFALVNPDLSFTRIPMWLVGSVLVSWGSLFIQRKITLQWRNYAK